MARGTRSAHSSQVQTLKGASLFASYIYQHGLTCVLDGFQCVSGMLQLCVRCNIKECKFPPTDEFVKRNQFSFVFFFASNVLTKLANVCVLLCCCCQGFKKVMLKSSFRELFFPNTIFERGCDKQDSYGT